MDYSVNTTPLLQDLDSEDEYTTDEVFNKENKPSLNDLECRDRYNMGYLIFYLLGIATLLPWNFYVTANDVSKRSRNTQKSLSILTSLRSNFIVLSFSHTFSFQYWMYKFRNVSTSNFSSTGFFSEYGKLTPLQKGFTSYLSLASSVPNLIFLAFNTAITRR